MTHWWLFLAQYDAWERLGKRFQDREVSWETWLGLALPFILIIGLLAFFKWWMGRGSVRLRSGPWALFRELATAHELNWGEKRLLKQILKAGRVAHPAHAFLDPAVYTNKDVARKLAAVWPRVLSLREKLFT